MGLEFLQGSCLQRRHHAWSSAEHRAGGWGKGQGCGPCFPRLHPPWELQCGHKQLGRPVSNRHSAAFSGY